MTQKILYIDMDKVLVDLNSFIPTLSPDILQKYDEIYDIPDIFSSIPPIEDAIESFHKLSMYFDTYILSTPSWENPSSWSDKLLWVKHFLGQPAYKKLILSHHKNLNRGHFLVDDRTVNGAGEFEGELILFGSPQFPNWKSVVNYLLERKN
jgi:5'-nucleotidase